MRILVTGAAGFIGSHVTDRVLADGHEAVLLDGFTDYYPRATKVANVAIATAHPRATFHELDLRTDDLAPALDGVEGVIHLAAMPGLPRSWTDMETYTACNLLATHRLIEASRMAGIQRFVHISTSSVYGTDALGDETQPLQPVSPYGVTKLAAEQLILAYVRTFGFPAAILRYFSIYGPRQRPDMAYHQFIEALIDRRDLTVFGDGHQTRSSTFVSDAVEGAVGALQGAEIGEVYNIGGGERIELLDVIRIIGEELGVEPVIHFEPARAGDQRHTGADTGKAERTFGYRPTVLPVDGLRAQIAWHCARRAEDK